MCDPKWSGSSSTKAKEVDTVAMHAASSDRDRVSATVLLQTFRSWVIAGNQSAYIRGIFDGGSQKKFVREDVSRQLGLPVLDEVTVRLNTFGDPETSISSHRRRLVQVRLRSQYDQKEHLIEAVEITFICKDLADATANDSFVDAIRREGGSIADEMFFSGAKAEVGICLLIGADQMWRFLKSDVRRSGADDRTVAVNTQLGWTFQGPTAVLSSVTGDITLTCALHVEASTEERPFDLRMFWELDGLGITDGENDQRSEDDAVWLHFQDTIQKEDGRYKVSLPWKTGSATLRDNREVAERRLRSLMKRLRSNKTLLLEYDCAMRKYLNDGHAEVVTAAEQAPTEHIYYMPHQAVVRENSTTTKLRVVFDVSSHAPGTASLNAHLEKGPKQNTELLPLLLRFRTVKVALVADIAKAFLQIVVREEDRDALRFLWCNETPKEDDHEPRLEEHYAATIETGLLGLRWNQHTDSIKLAECSPPNTTSAGNTKRSVLQLSASIFDPLGVASPFTIRARMLFQRIWQHGLNWDDELPEEVALEWKRWCEELPDMARIEIPRYVSQGVEDIANAIQVHVFTDASQSAYGATVYLRTEDVNGKVVVTLMVAKARVAPLKTLTLPRLELMGALIGCRLAKSLLGSLSHLPLQLIFWTDSNIVLCWIKGSALRWKQFVRNRVTEIQTATDLAAWRHCPGEQNPADLLTRGESMEKLLHSKIWFRGPAWLSESAELRPSGTHEPQVNEETVEAERVKIQVLFVDTDTTTSSLLRLDNYSSWYFVLRLTAWIRRFADRCRRKKRRQGPLTANEVHEAEVHWVKEAQRSEYYKELQELAGGGMVSPKSPIALLQPVLDQDDILRISGRLQHSTLPTDVRHPVLLPHGHSHRTDR
ncbi:uncharacterized protein LOC135389581 [Ornithodoros turicata]|uniref:uncharacterized protein LOC135389581 n=1 Tax=Ornithodoros turicata TaxID=34597 RepID=UPI00313940A8